MQASINSSLSSLEQFHIPQTIASDIPVAVLQNSINDTEMTANLDQQPAEHPFATYPIEERILVGESCDRGEEAHRIPDDDVEVAVISEIASNLPTYKSQVGEELESLPIATATALGTIQRACVRRVIGLERFASASTSSSSTSTSAMSSSYEAVSQVVEGEELEEHLRQCAQEARLRFEEAERQLRALQRAKLERTASATCVDISIASVLPPPQRRSAIVSEVAQQLQQQMIYQDEETSRQQAAKLQADRRTAEQLQQQSFQCPSKKEQNTSYSVLSSSSPNRKRRHHLRDLSRNLAHNRFAATAKPRRTIQTNQNEELLI